MTVKQGERLDDLLGRPGKIIQSDDVFSFSLDAVLLAEFVWVPIQKGKLVDLCAGTGAIPLFLSYRTKGTITGVEIQPRLVDMANRSIAINELDGRLNIVEGDVKTAASQLGHARYDVVTCNPPYFLANETSLRNQNEHHTIARHEVLCTLEDCIRSASQLVKPGGKVAFVHRPERLLDILTLMRAYRIEPKRMQLVYPKQGRDANTLLIEGSKDGKAGLTILPPFVVYEEDDTYTSDMRAILDA
ncbi:MULTISPECIES: tRNA1(Val) (adenine(37)-N6)-methyltransferase [Exiguobacterium]|uniref:tRNA1(Val) (adenine(37)-N6)-methyltransferase n=1 Tax=Exiguobacterium TaxID=33986 RepID=UPI001BEA8B94|nr:MULTISPECIES: tRNA1(Val) (adenine(37)-N6)-methyltransferase [Exiguobacterium]MCT4778286.1 tRNA1(Val) (adenine(37)-N6)-methyltransferase [Exiguobacterium aquaticum]MCT4790346.1 tRNA1(Val) (adenine(37)-N6)-methyltransferase [Exiguobacterium mexicanum]